MKITLSDVPDYIAFRYPAAGAEEQKEKAAKMVEKFSEYCGEEEMVFLSRDSDRKIEGALLCIKLQEGVHAAANIYIGDGRSDGEVFRRLMSDAMAGKKKMNMRLLSGSNEAGRKAVLLDLGFKAGEERREFRCDLAKLPSEDKSAIVWEALPDLSEKSYGYAAEILKACASGDPDFAPDDNPYELLQSYMNERGLNATADCIHVGKIDSKAAAIVVAQVQPSDGWSRITYMGMMPEFRGKGLGTAVHRHGFAMMKAQGGKLYHGGTLAKNTAMIKLFEQHGVEPYRQMQEWVFVK